MQGAILTDIGITKISSATPLDQLRIVSFAVGDGGGVYQPLSPEMTSLVNEVWRGLASAPIRDDDNPAVIIFEATIPSGSGGFDIRECAIFDDEDNMIAIGHTSLTQKPPGTTTTALTLTIRMWIALESTSQVELINQDGGEFDHNGLSNRDGVDCHPASSISATPVLDVLAAENVQSGLVELAEFDKSKTFINANTKQKALELLGSSYIFIDSVLGDKVNYGPDFDDVDAFDLLLGKVYDETATAEEIAIVAAVNNKLGLKAN